MFDLDPQGDNQLAFKKGDVIEVVDTTDDNWWYGALRERNGEPFTENAQGLFPTNYFQAYAVEKKKKIRIKVPQGSKILQLQQSILALKNASAEKLTGTKKDSSTSNPSIVAKAAELSKALSFGSESSQEDSQKDENGQKSPSKLQHVYLVIFLFSLLCFGDF